MTTAAASAALSVASLNRLVRDCLEAAFPLTWVGGEVSNLTYAASGHVYFSLKDAQAQVRCVMWRNRAQTLGWRLENGQKIEARALVSFYEPRGEFQLNIEAIRRAGQGDLFERFLRLKEKLEKEGIFAVDRKRPPPTFPRHIAIVSSLQAAALRDVLITLRRRAPHVGITLFPTPVQGEGAAQRIADALGEASRHGCDVVILCRGGGSIEDLWSFNEECVARAIRACPIPVIAGIGHETDFTIADFAADLRAATPTAAAELASPARDALLARLDMLMEQSRRHMQRRIGDQEQRLDWLASRLIHPSTRLAQQRLAVDAQGQRLIMALERRLEALRQRMAVVQQRHALARPNVALHGQHLESCRRRLNDHTRWAISQQFGKLIVLSSGLRQLDPHAVLKRGYAIVTDSSGNAIRDTATLHPGHILNLAFARGNAQARVEQVVASPEAD